MTEPRTHFNIPQPNYAKFEAKIEKLSRRSVKLTGEQIVPIPYGFHFDPHPYYKGQQIKIIEVYLDAPEAKIDGWSFVATLDHSQDVGTIIRKVPNCENVEIPATYRNCEPNCDHCNVRRRRRDTFLMRSTETGEFKQVGASCIVDFFGHDHVRVAAIAELLSLASECARGYADPIDGLLDFRYLPLDEYLGHVAAVMRARGWTSKAAAKETGEDSTASQALSNMNHHFDRERYYYRGYVTPTDADAALADEAIEWLRGMCENDIRSDYIHNICVIAKSEAIEYRAAGLAASIIAAYQREKGRAAEREKQASSSVHLGTVGARLDFDVTVVAATSRETDYGYTYIYRFETAEGNVITTFASRSLGVYVGDKRTIRGTVKKHDEFKNVKQTILTRVQVK